MAPVDEPEVGADEDAAFATAGLAACTRVAGVPFSAACACACASAACTAAESFASLALVASASCCLLAISLLEDTFAFVVML